MSKTDKLLEIKNLNISFSNPDGIVQVVDNMNFYIGAGETLGVVGESGCGKSITALSIMRLIASPPAVVDGEILFNDKNLLKVSNSEMRKIRGNKISMIFQEPMTSLNPVITIGEQIIEVFRLHQNLSHKESVKKSLEILSMVGIALPERRMKEYPHQLSGGMRQRIMIAMALACNPKLLIADEPTTALDVTIQAQILNLMKKLKQETNTSILLITHDLGVVAEMCSRAIIVYCGRIMEEAPVESLFSNPLHPYTEGLLKSLPKMGVKEKLFVIPGTVPSPSQWPTGCVFNPRCAYASEKCRNQEPPMIKANDGHFVRCWLRINEDKTGVV